MIGSAAEEARNDRRPSGMKTLRAVCVALLFLAAAALPAFDPGAADAGAPDEAQILVKCKKGDVARVVAALARERVRVYDLETMKQLHDPGKPGVLPALPNAVEVAAELYNALGSLRKDATFLRTRDLAVHPKRMSATIEVDSPATADRIPGAFAESPYFRRREARTELGALARADGRWTIKIDLVFGSAGSTDAPPEGLGRIPLHMVMENARLAGVQVTTAGAERVTRDRRTGASVASRELSLAPGRLEALTKFMTRIQGAVGLTLTEMRWKRDPKSQDADGIGRAVVRVATRATPR